MKRTPMPRSKGFTSKRKPMKQRSDKRKAYRASDEGQAALEYMRAVKELPCCICHRPGPSQAHHCTGDRMARSDWHTIPLCYEDHQGPNGYHARKRTWEEKNGKDHSYIAETQLQILGEVRDV